jgi:hypothetical protein
MVRDRHNDVENPTDREYIKTQLKAIKAAKKRGDEAEAQRLTSNLIQWLGWDDNDF